jgi:two-component system, chemotaxis family, protein-glutamate methylesterase/glutaminase
MIRVLIADDSATARVLLRGILESDPQVRVVGEATNGAEAVELARGLRPELITMDVNMPVMDGLEATKQIMMSAPTPIIIVSAIERAALDLSFDATQAGALIVVRKPAGPGDARYVMDRDQLVGMVKAMAQVKVVRRWGAPAATARPPRVRRTPAEGQLVVIGTSTGGPAALRRLLADLPSDFPAPVLVVQHIARGFISGLASWLGGGSRLPVRVAEDMQQLERATMLLAPDDRHLGVTRAGRVELSDAPAISGFRPSVTHLFRSAAQAYGPGVVAILLTGMGSDGVDGLRDVRESGGRILAQDAETSVVYGMAQEAVRAGLCSTLLPLERIAEHLADIVV